MAKKKSIHIPGKRRNKFGAIRTIVHGIKFHSKAEAKRYEELFCLRTAGVIRDLKLQVKYPLHAPNMAVVCHYVADFVYEELIGDKWVEVVEDVKGKLTDIYKLKRKWMSMEHGIEIKEVYMTKRKRK